MGLYIHLPWCVRKCPYCDFNSHQAPADLATREADYVDALLADWATENAWLGDDDRPIETIFFGGGTPSLFSATALARLLDGIRARRPIAPQAEITLEANPGTAEQQKFAAFRDIGINRLSLGIQSFHPEHLKSLGRIHDGDEAIRAVELAQRAGFTEINLDLMVGLPHQTQDDALADLAQALALAPTHLSHYQLTLEPHTPFARQPPPLPPDDAIDAMITACQAALQTAGFTQYEVSAYARAGHRCRHNLNYWTFGDYVGIGAGAHGKLTRRTAAGFQGHRRAKWRSPSRYVAAAHRGDACETAGPIADADLAFEFLLNALRLVDGVPTDLFTARTGASWAPWQRPLQRAVARGLLVMDDRLYTTPQGFRFLNDVLTLFLP